MSLQGNTAIESKEEKQPAPAKKDSLVLPPTLVPEDDETPATSISQTVPSNSDTMLPQPNLPVVSNTVPFVKPRCASQLNSRPASMSVSFVGPVSPVPLSTSAPPEPEIVVTLTKSDGITRPPMKLERNAFSMSMSVLPPRNSTPQAAAVSRPKADWRAETKKIWARNIDVLPVAIDLPRLSSHLTIFDCRTGKTLFIHFIYN